MLGQAPETYAIDNQGPDELMARRAELLGPSLSVSYKNKLKIVRGEGAYLYDHTGRAHLDCVNNITHIGHCHPHLVEAISRQAAILNTNTRYLNELVLDFAERITSKLPDSLSVAYFVNSGTEANELALRIARHANGQKNTVVLDWGYHGNSQGAVDISPYKFKRKGGFPQPDFVEIAEFPDPYRGPHKGYSENSGKAYAKSVADCVSNIKAKTGNGAATFIAESISGVGGQIAYPQGYLKAAYEAIRAEGGICVADEVQCGFGRVGDHFWGFELQDVVPDIVVIGKPIGNGHPLAAVVTTKELAEKFANGMEYFNSFGGNPVSMAVGMAVMDVIENENMQSHAKELGQYILNRWQPLKDKFEFVGDVRGHGLFLGIELVLDRGTLEPATQLATDIVNEMRERGILLSTDGPLENVLKFKPPMVFSRENADFLCDTLEEVMAEFA
jgi:4-aminobutyrate aminotransferase-like enzyme